MAATSHYWLLVYSAVFLVPLWFFAVLAPRVPLIMSCCHANSSSMYPFLLTAACRGTSLANSSVSHCVESFPQVHWCVTNGIVGVFFARHRQDVRLPGSCSALSLYIVWFEDYPALDGHR